jgi:hypothetical protein
VKVALRAMFLSAAGFFATCVLCAAQVPGIREVPHITMENGTGQLIVSGEPILILGGELGNSSVGTAAQAACLRGTLRYG